VAVNVVAAPESGLLLLTAIEAVGVASVIVIPLDVLDSEKAFDTMQRKTALLSLSPAVKT
jgi:hypothetical protein